MQTYVFNEIFRKFSSEPNLFLVLPNRNERRSQQAAHPSRGILNSPQLAARHQFSACCCPCCPHTHPMIIPSLAPALLLLTAPKLGSIHHTNMASQLSVDRYAKCENMHETLSHIESQQSLRVRPLRPGGTAVSMAPATTRFFFRTRTLCILLLSIQGYGSEDEMRSFGFHTCCSCYACTPKKYNQQSQTGVQWQRRSPFPYRDMQNSVSKRRIHLYGQAGDRDFAVVMW